MTPEIFAYTHQGHLGHIGELVLNRPHALNAINMHMSQKLEYALQQWQTQGHVKAVLIYGEGPRAFCAGGDLKTLLHVIDTKQQPGGKKDFLRHQYRLVHQLHAYPIPLLVYGHGFTFGGGVGMMAHATHRIADPACQWAMPETSIGFVPDVGAMHFFNQCPGEIGTFLALTGHRINMADALYCGVIDHIWPMAKRDALLKTLIECNTDIDTDLKTLFANNPEATFPKGQLPEWRSKIDDAFQYNTVGDIMAHLAQQDTPWHRSTHQQLQQRSPHSLALTLAGLRHCRDQSLATCLNVEYCMSWACLKHPDLKTGITSAIISKDHAPIWQHTVPDASAIDAILAEGHANPLDLP